MKITKRQLRRIIRESLNEDPSRPWGSYAEKGKDSFYDVIVMSPNGDSLLVDGMETYTQDVPSQLQHASGIEMDDVTGAALVAELETQMMSGYVEKAVEYKDGQWSWQ